MFGMENFVDLGDLKRRLYFPALGFDKSNENFMKNSDCSSVDFQSQRFVEICAELDCDPAYHRKLWEWVYIVHHLRRKGVIAPNKRGLVFGVGTEPLPSLFVKHGAEIVATDAPPEIIQGAGWSTTNQHAENLEAMFKENIVSRADFFRNATHGYCDMNNISSDLSGFDFCWSSCCLEHLGSLEKGIEFIVNSVENTLSVGGVACHTTELNLSSNDETVKTGPTVIYRKRDIEDLASSLRERGHQVDEIIFSNSQNFIDSFVDIPPYADGMPHIRLELEKYVVTSVGLVITRGR